MAQFSLTIEQIRTAEERVRPHIRQTPVLDADDVLPGIQAHFKLELLQHAGSFKARGAFNTLLSTAIPPSGVVAASGGNHGYAVAFAAQRLGVPAHIFVPEISDPAKQAKIRAAGAQLRVGGARYVDALQASEDHVAKTGALPIHAYNDVTTLAGQATLGLEWLAQIEDMGGCDTLMIAVGGGGLIGGITNAIQVTNEKPVKVVAVEPVGSACLNAALTAGNIIDVEVHSIAADSLGARSVGNKAFDICRRAYASNHLMSVCVTDQDILMAQTWLWQTHQLISEAGGATALAALLGGHYKPRPSERVGILLCGANTDPAHFAQTVLKKP